MCDFMQTVKRELFLKKCRTNKDIIIIIITVSQLHLSPRTTYLWHFSFHFMVWYFKICLTDIEFVLKREMAHLHTRRDFIQTGVCVWEIAFDSSGQVTAQGFAVAGASSAHQAYSQRTITQDTNWACVFFSTIHLCLCERNTWQTSGVGYKDNVSLH